MLLRVPLPIDMFTSCYFWLDQRTVLF